MNNCYFRINWSFHDQSNDEFVYHTIFEGLFKNDFPAGYVLEAPFTSYIEHIHHDNKRIRWIMKHLRMDDISLSLIAADLEFDTKFRIRNIKKPLFILHAEDDAKVSFECGGQSLFQICSNFNHEVTTHQGS